MTDKIKEALAKLDTANDNHWTADGSPRIETIRMLAGDSKLTREDVTNADAEFNRDVAKERAAKAQEAATQADGQRKLGELAQAQNVDATGAPSGVPSQGMPPPDGAEAKTPAAGSVVAPDGATANPNAESDNQAGTGEVDQDAVQEQFDEGLAQLKKQIDAGEDYLSRLTAQRDEIGIEITTVQQQLDTLKSKLPSAEPDHRENMAVIQGFLRSQQEARDRRADRAIEDAGGRPRVALRDKSPVDQALQSRKRDAHGSVKTVQQ